MKKLKLLLMLVIVMTMGSTVYAFESTWVKDDSNTLTSETHTLVRRFNERMAHEQISPQVGIEILNDLSEDMNTYKHKRFNELGVGSAKDNSGLLLVIAMNDRKFGIEVGYGLEERVTDLEAGRMLDNMKVHMREYSETGDVVHVNNAIEEFIARVEVVVGPEYVPVQKETGSLSEELFGKIGLVAFMMLTVFIKAGSSFIAKRKENKVIKRARVDFEDSYEYYVKSGFRNELTKEKYMKLFEHEIYRMRDTRGVTWDTYTSEREGFVNKFMLETYIETIGRVDNYDFHREYAKKNLNKYSKLEKEASFKGFQEHVNTMLEMMQIHLNNIEKNVHKEIVSFVRQYPEVEASILKHRVTKAMKLSIYTADEMRSMRTDEIQAYIQQAYREELVDRALEDNAFYEYKSSFRNTAYKAIENRDVSKLTPGVVLAILLTVFPAFVREKEAEEEHKRRRHQSSYSSFNSFGGFGDGSSGSSSGGGFGGGFGGGSSGGGGASGGW